MKWLIQLIKKIFLKKQIEADVLKENVEAEFLTVEVAVKNINWEAIDKINGHSLVLVKMTKEEIKNDKIELAHQRRPFVVEEKNEETETMTGYYLTSNINNCVFNKCKGLRLVLNKDNYKLNKNSLVLINKKIELPFENLISYFDPVDDMDLRRLKKYRNLICDIPTFSNEENNVIEIGDIVFYDNLKYIIFQIDNTNCYGYAIKNTNCCIDYEDYHYIKYNQKFYFVDYQNHKVFNKLETIQIVDRFDEQIVSEIIENKKALKHQNKIKKMVK